MRVRPKGRPKKYAAYEKVLQDNPPKSMKKRPVYVDGIGIFRGSRGDTAWIKLRLEKGTVFKGKSYPAGSALEIKVGQLSSFTWEELEKIYDEYRRKADHGEPLEDEQPLTFKEFAEDWLHHAMTRTKSATNQYDVEKILIPVFGDKLLSRLSSVDIDRWQTKRLNDVKPGTLQRNKNTLKAILNSALRHGLIDKNPCDNSYKIKGVQDYARYYTPEETLKICNAAKELDDDGWFADFILFALYTGMRRGEILALLWSDIKELPDGHKVIHIQTSKSDKGRTIPCTEDLNELLTRQKDRIEIFRKSRIWRLPKDDNRVFPVSESTVKRRWQDAKKLAGIAQGRMHDWRATNITYALLSGVDPKTLTSITGHKDMQMIDKHYARVVEHAVSSAMNKTGSYISEALKKAEENNSKD
ncbi:MAG: site-specific integrase [Proteobacteria bacterium]|nr:site-specific integrase [Pseudomonadota bacterium]